MKKSCRRRSALLSSSSSSSTTCFFRNLAGLAVLLTQISCTSASTSTGRVPCTNSQICQRLVHSNSTCLPYHPTRPDALTSSSSTSSSTRYCSNPYISGCLASRTSPGSSTSIAAKIRVCNSEDPPDAASKGYCRIPPIAYPELRIYSQNWESAMFESWILQITLGEILDVPVTLETGLPNATLNFYDPYNAFDYGLSVDLQSLQGFVEHGYDCRKVSQLDRKENAASYIPCAQMIPELWDSISQTMLRDMVEKGTLDPPSNLGVLGQEAWFVPKFTAERDPEILNYLGLQGEDNRAKLADMFLLPSTWQEYCTMVSNTSCSQPDDVAQRPPKDETEQSMMFSQGLYTGYFRKPPENECQFANTTASTSNATTITTTILPFANASTNYTTYGINRVSAGKCSGVLIDYPCGWGSNSEAQAYWLDIALRSYLTFTYAQMTQIWRAANATKSNVMMMWWSPEALYNEFQGTDAEFIKVTMPTPTQECLETRVQIDDRCTSDWRKRVGHPPVCDDPPKALRKVILRVLYDIIYKSPVEIRSPAYDALNLFSISELQLGEMFQNWKNSSTPRDAICDWVSNNLDVLQTYIPRTYPRVYELMPYEGPLSYATLALGGCVTLLVVITSLLVFRQRNRRVMRYAQVEFLFLLLVGSLTISVGAILMAAPPSDASCVAAIWLINLGYTLELVPLIVKVAALNRLMQAARKMRRVVLKRTALFGAVASISALMVLFLIFWSAYDPPQSLPDYTLTSNETPQGETVVSVNYYCSSNSDVWMFVSAGWNAVLLLCATILAIQSRKLQQDFNESHTLAILIYSHFVFVMLRVITFILPLDGDIKLECQSIIFSLDTLTTIIIYFVPKFWTSDDGSHHRTSVFVSGELSSRNSFAPNQSHNDLAASVRFASDLLCEISQDELDNHTESHSEVAGADTLGVPASSDDGTNHLEALECLSDPQQRDTEASTDLDVENHRYALPENSDDVLRDESTDYQSLLQQSQTRIHDLEEEVRSLAIANHQLSSLLREQQPPSDDA